MYVKNTDISLSNVISSSKEFQQQFPFPDLVGNPLVSTIQSRIVERGKVSEMNEFLMVRLIFQFLS